MEQKKKQFVFKGYDADLARGLAYFYFEAAVKNKIWNFKETIYFPALKNNSDINPILVKTIFNNLLLILGISYWKLFCPANIKILPFEMSRDQANFWNTVYTKGLGEFFYKNKIDFRKLVRFPYDNSQTVRPLRLPRRSRSLLMLGGGKDSLVSAELLKKQKKLFTIFSVNEHPIHTKLIRLIKAPSLTIRRELDPQLFTLNEKRSVFYNGHVPASAIYAFIGLLVALLYDYRYIIASNEKSANYGNVEYLGEIINHQWSKSAEFEKLFNGYLHAFITPDISYHSLLRPYTELAISKIFSRYPKYFPVFTSCNTNFRIIKKTQKRWCGKCSKCAFVFLCLACYLSKGEVIKIFGKNLLADKTLLPLYQELLGLKNLKPFECVGTPEETRLAFFMIHKRGEYDNYFIIRHVLRNLNS